MFKNFQSSSSKAHHTRPGSVSRGLSLEWFLVQRTGTRTFAYNLKPFSVIVIGREQCDISIQSASVEKRHAVLCYDQNSECFSLKDLNSTNGTFLNNRRISSERPEKLNNMDLLRFGYDPNLYEIRLGTSTSETNHPEEINTEQSRSSKRLPVFGPDHRVTSTDGQAFVAQGAAGRGTGLYSSRVSSPSLTLDSGRGSSSAPSSPAKEMSPGPLPNTLSSNLRSPTVSHKPLRTMQTISSSDNNQCQSNRLDCQQQNTRLNYSSGDYLYQSDKTSTELLRGDSLEEISKVDQSLVMVSDNVRDLDADIHVPNEIFDPNLHLEAKEETNVPQRIELEDMEPKSLNSESNTSVVSDNPSETSVDKKSNPPMAFTIDFDNGPKKFGIADSISKFAPRHRRTKSNVKGEELGGECDAVVHSHSEMSHSVRTSRKKPTTVPTSKSHASLVANRDGMDSDSTASKKSAPGNSSASFRFSGASRSSVSRNKEVDKSSNAVPNIKTSVSKNAAKPNHKSKAEVMKKNCDKDVDKEDASSETGTYTVEKDKSEPEVEKAREEVANLVSNNDSGLELGADDTGSGPSLSSEWVREWAEQAAIQHKIIRDCNPINDTQLLLQETETVVSAMQERVTRNLSNHNSSHNSDSDDEATFPLSPAKSKPPSKKPLSTRTVPFAREASVLSDSGYQIGYQSDSSNEGFKEYKNIGSVKMNKAFNIRRGRVMGYESDSCSAPQGNSSNSVSFRGMSPRPSVGGIGTMTSAATNAPFSRNDGGRFSLRMSKSKNPSNLMPPPKAPLRTTPVSSPKTTFNRVDNGSSRSRQGNITAHQTNPVTKKPPTGTPRSNSTLTAKEVELANWKRRKSYDPMRAAAEGRKKRGSLSAAETTLSDIPPTASSRNSMSHSMSFHSERNFRAPHRQEEEDMIYIVDEVDSSHSNSPMHLPMSRSSNEDSYYGHNSPRHKNKLEALDNLVIATIHSLSGKVRNSSRNLLEKLQLQYSDNENGALLEEMASQLKELEASSNNSSPNKSPSRELSGTLKNLKKLEQVILVLDRVLCDDSGSDINC